VNQQLCAGGLLQLRIGAHVIKMTMGVDNRGYREATHLNCGQYPLRVTAGIHYDRLAG